MRRFVFRNETDPSLPLLNENEVVNYQLSNVELAFTMDSIVGEGKLYVTSNRIIWISDQLAYDFDVQHIILHAVTSDLNSYPKPCLYCQFNVEGDYDNNTENAQCEEDELIDDENSGQIAKKSDSSDNNPSEMFLAPLKSDDIKNLFDAFSKAALDNPDDMEVDEFDGDLIYNVDEVRLGAEQANALAHLDSILQIPDDMKLVSDD